MLRLPLSLATLLVSSLMPSAYGLNWKSTREKPAFSDADGEKVRGVNLGGWFVLENWMQSTMFAVPPLDEQTISDEWSFCAALGKAECSTRLQAHYASYIVESDFAEIAQRGLNTVRIPFPYWPLIPLEDYEPYVNASQIDYLQQGLRWAKQYNLDVMVDLHTVPGSQNGYDNSGRLLSNPAWCDNTTNVDRSVEAVARLTEIITAEEFGGVVKAIEVINEPILDTTIEGGCPFETLAAYYVRAYDALRASEYTLEGAYPVMAVIHDAFQPIANWEYFFTTDDYGASWDNFGLDTHIYQAFGDAPSYSQEQHLNTPCTRSAELAASNAQWSTFVGEFSLGTQTYCVAYAECVNVSMETNIQDSLEQSVFINHLWEAQREVYEQSAGWLFWSWKTDAAPTWSFQQSARQGWIPEGLTNDLYSYNSSATEYCSLLKDSSEEPTFTTSYVATSAALANETIADADADTDSSTGTNSTSATGSTPAQGIGASSSDSGAVPSIFSPAGLAASALFLASALAQLA